MANVETDDTGSFGDAGFITISAQSAEDAAMLYDFSGRDLILHVDIDLGMIKPVNFVTIDPVLFSVSTFIKVLDVATSIEEGENFVTVDGFAEQIYDKILTPEANKQLQIEGIAKELGPVNFNVQGLGVFAFPMTDARKIRLTLLMEEPTSNFYERLHVLMQNITTVTTTTKAKKKKWLCWVAREVYGLQDRRWSQFRTWLIVEAPIWFVKLYIKHGEMIAKYISNKPRVKSIIKRWMDKKINNHG